MVTRTHVALLFVYTLGLSPSSARRDLAQAPPWN
jgi:hypothetical protein